VRRDGFRPYFPRIDDERPDLSRRRAVEERDPERRERRSAGKGEKQSWNYCIDRFRAVLPPRASSRRGAAGLVGVALSKAAGQPHMEAALKALQNAASQLQDAADDKGGHRAKAIQLVSQAINQVQQGIQAGAGQE